MATSGYFLTSDSGQGGGGYFGQLAFEWWRTDWGRSGGVGYHNISYKLSAWGGSAGNWQYTYNNSMNVDGTGYSRGQTQVYGAGATIILNGGKTLWTDGAGNRSFGASAQAGIYTASINTSGSGSWSMDNIPMYATISGTSGSINDETSNVFINYSNPAGGSVSGKLYVRAGTSGGWTLIATRSGYGSGVNFSLTTGERNAIRSTLANSNTGQVLYRVSTGVGDTDSVSSLSIINANPVFTVATYKDANSSTVAVTGDDQYIVQGLSEIEVDIASADKAVAQKSATMVKYNMAIGSINEDVTYDTDDIEENLGTLGINSNADLIVKAIDSRNNQTSVTLPVNILPYLAPQITPTVQRVNNFETETNISVEAIFSQLLIDDVAKNSVNATTGIKYRYKKTTDVSWSSWVNLANSTTGGNVSVTEFEEDFDRNYAWNMEFTVTDAFNTTTFALILPVGIPIFRIGLDGKIYNNEKTIHPCPWRIGDVIISTISDNPADEFEGTTWVAWGTGRVPVGVDTGQTEFNTVEKTGGHKLLQSHNHGNVSSWPSNYTGVRSGNGGGGLHLWANSFVGNDAGIWTNAFQHQHGSAGSGDSQNLQPYITAYMWKRTA